jgi:hypothetical protein
VKIYGIYIGYDFLSIAVRNVDAPVITPLLIHPLHRTMDRQLEVTAAFERIAAEKIIVSEKTSVAVLSFESFENILFTTPVANEVPDVTEMMSWEMFMRTDESVKNYNISSFPIHDNVYIVAASKLRDIDFFTRQVNRLGLRVITIEPSLISFINLFELNYDVSGENLIAVLGCHKITIAYIKDGKLIDIAQNTIHVSELISSQDVMKVRAEISNKNSIDTNVPLYLTGDLLADKDYADFISADLLNCSYIDPFKCIVANDDSNKELMGKYSLAFGVAVSLSQKMV